MSGITTCKELVGQLLEFLDGDLSTEQRARIETHLCGCQPCAAYVESYRLVIEVGRRLKSAPADLPPHVAVRMRTVLATLGPEAPG